MVQVQPLSCTNCMRSIADAQFSFSCTFGNDVRITLALLLACNVVSPCWARRRSLPTLLALKLAE